MIFANLQATFLKYLILRLTKTQLFFDISLQETYLEISTVDVFDTATLNSHSLFKFT